MKKNFESIKSKSKRIANGFLLQLLFYCSPGIHLDPYVSAYALIWTPILLIFSIITVTDIFSITSKDIRIISFIVDRTLKNNAVVAVPTRDVCAFCDSHSEEGIKELLGVINNIKQSTAVTISDSLLIRKGNTWHPYSLQENYV